MHIPVLLSEVKDMLLPKPGGIYVDATFGAGGYSTAILDQKDTRVIAFDKDPDAIHRGEPLQSKYTGDRFTLIHDSFAHIHVHLEKLNIPFIDGVVYDLGFSSFQIDDPERGFSFRLDGPLDMRMSKEGQTVADVVNTFSERDLANLIYNYGEEKKSFRVAKAIAETRRIKPFETTKELANCIRGVLPRTKNGQDPATLTFQALRIFVNNELIDLKDSLNSVRTCLNPFGKIIVVTFHSLEDRLVKNCFKELISTKLWQPISKKPITPSREETLENSRSRSAKLRGIVHLG